MNSSETKSDTGIKDIDILIETLKSKDGITRQNARNSLVEIGKPALDALIKAFKIKEDPVHWEVAKALSQIGTAKAAQALVDALEDKDFSVRWIAAEGLIHVGFDGLIPLLKTLRDKSDSVWMREGCHHVIHDLVNRKILFEATRKCLMPVLDSLNQFDTVIKTNTAASRALEIIRRQEKAA